MKVVSGKTEAQGFSFYTQTDKPQGKNPPKSNPSNHPVVEHLLLGLGPVHTPWCRPVVQLLWGT